MMRQYAYLTISVLLLMVATVACFNYLVDPYAIHRFDEADLVRRMSVDQAYKVRTSKPWQVKQLKPSVVLVGSSRTASINIDHPRWQGATSYSFAMAGLTLYEMLRLIQHTHAQNGLQKLTIGLEYETFVFGEYHVGAGFAEGRLAGAEPAIPGVDRALQTIRDIHETLLTGQATMASLNALISPSDSHSQYAAGDREAPRHVPNPKGSYMRGEHGYQMIGRHILRQAQNADRHFHDNLEVFSRILEYCYRKNIDTRLYLSPEHLSITHLRQQINLGPSWEEFHHQIVRLNTHAAGFSRRTPFPLYGFNHLAGIVDEPPPVGAGFEDDWFLDGVHFRAELGDLIMEQLWDVERDRGQLLDEDSIAAYLDQVETMRARFVSENKNQVFYYREKILGQGPARPGQARPGPGGIVSIPKG